MGASNGPADTCVLETQLHLPGFQALRELMLPGCSGAGEDTGGPFHLSLFPAPPEPPWPHPAPPAIHPHRCKKRSGLPVLPTSPCRLSSWENQARILIYIMLIAVI